MKLVRGAGRVHTQNSAELMAMEGDARHATPFALVRGLLRAGVFGRQVLRVSQRAADLFWPVRGLPRLW